MVSKNCAGVLYPVVKPQSAKIGTADFERKEYVILPSVQTGKVYCDMPEREVRLPMCCEVFRSGSDGNSARMKRLQD
jgi:hypothetical protein